MSSQVTLTDLYGQLKDSISILTTQNSSFKGIIDQKDHELHFQNKKIDQLQEKVGDCTKQISQQETLIEGWQSQDRKIKAEIEELRTQVGDSKRYLLFEKENNKLLVNSLHELKEKNEGLSMQFQQLEEKVKAVAPSIEQVLALPEANEHATLIDLTSAVEKHLSGYIERDAKMFLT